MRCAGVVRRADEYVGQTGVAVWVSPNEASWSFVDGIGAVHTGTGDAALTLGVSPEGRGTVAVEPDQQTYDHGSVVEITATANAGWVFDHWEGNVIGGAGASFRTRVTADLTITAVFVEEDSEGDGAGCFGGALSAHGGGRTKRHTGDALLVALVSAGLVIASMRSAQRREMG